MVLSYLTLSDDDKLEEAIRFVAVGQDMPADLEAFLKDNDLYDLITKPVESDQWNSQLQLSLQT